jgi:sugar lactone lactonase YvrE
MVALTNVCAGAAGMRRMPPTREIAIEPAKTPWDVVVCERLGLALIGCNGLPARIEEPKAQPEVLAVDVRSGEIVQRLPVDGLAAVWLSAGDRYVVVGSRRGRTGALTLRVYRPENLDHDEFSVTTSKGPGDVAADEAGTLYMSTYDQYKLTRVTNGEELVRDVEFNPAGVFVRGNSPVFYVGGQHLTSEDLPDDPEAASKIEADTVGMAVIRRDTLETVQTLRWPHPRIVNAIAFWQDGNALVCESASTEICVLPLADDGGLKPPQFIRVEGYLLGWFALDQKRSLAYWPGVDKESRSAAIYVIDLRASKLLGAVDVADHLLDQPRLAMCQSTDELWLLAEDLARVAVYKVPDLISLAQEPLEQ